MHLEFLHRIGHIVGGGRPLAGDEGGKKEGEEKRGEGWDLHGGRVLRRLQKFTRWEVEGGKRWSGTGYRKEIGAFMYGIGQFF